MKSISRAILCLIALFTVSLAHAADRPNILWITSEDNGPELGCYGDTYADTPNIDSIASKGMLYLNCWSTAPVCAPARTTLISGIYPPSTGSEHMRSMTRLPDGFKMYPQYLREVGYYCTNNSKEDYNLKKPGQVWDESSRKAHWKNRKPGQPFFAVFNHTISHESKIRSRPHTLVHDPAKVRVRAYHPDTPEVRHDWAQYYDKITEMDTLVGKNIKELQQAGLAEDTIIFYYGDHGSGMPRSKRWPYNSGLRVPLVIYVPEKFKNLAPKEYLTGGESDRLVGFIDFAPTLLSLTGIKPPEQFQGYAFMGKHETREQPFIYGFRGRMDERYDMLRVVRDKRYLYIRNYMPHKIYGQHIDYMFQTPTTQVWKKLYDAGKLNEVQSRFWKTKPAEELYDLQNDQDEIHNLAKSPEHQKILKKLRKAQVQLAIKIRDVGFLPEHEIHARSSKSTPYEYGHSEKYQSRKIIRTAGLASSLDPKATPKLIKAMQDQDSAVRYWATMGLLMRGKNSVSAGHAALTKALSDNAPAVQIAAAEALGRYGNKQDQSKAVDVLLKAANLENHSLFAAMAALNALDYLDHKADGVKEQIANLPRKDPKADRRLGNYVNRLIEETILDLK